MAALLRILFIDKNNFLFVLLLMKVCKKKVVQNVPLILAEAGSLVDEQLSLKAEVCEFDSGCRTSLVTQAQNRFHYNLI